MLKNVAKNRGKGYAQKAEENKNEDSGKATSEAGDKVVDREDCKDSCRLFLGVGGGGSLNN
jgi:hypothetical protein